MIRRGSWVPGARRVSLSAVVSDLFLDDGLILDVGSLRGSAEVAVLALSLGPACHWPGESLLGAVTNCAAASLAVVRVAASEATSVASSS
jgi:hypothetical protein